MICDSTWKERSIQSSFGVEAPDAGPIGRRRAQQSAASFDHRGTGMQAEARAEGRPAAAAPLLRQLPAGSSRLQGGATGVLDMMLVGLRRVPEGHDAVADELVDRAAMRADRTGQGIEVA